MTPYTFGRMCVDLAEDVRGVPEEHELTSLVAQRLRLLLDGPFEPPLGAMRPDAARYVMYPLFVAPDGAFSVAAAVWNVGQRTPVHGHETWGVVGIYAGTERETRYVKPTEAGLPLREAVTNDWGQGQVAVCCTTDDDIHRVACGSSVPCVGIHVYGADIGRLRRRSYDPVTGEVTWFVSEWTDFDRGC